MPRAIELANAFRRRRPRQVLPAPDDEAPHPDLIELARALGRIQARRDMAAERAAAAGSPCFPPPGSLDWEPDPGD